jgi:hypothetical protein
MLGVRGAWLVGGGLCMSMEDPDACQETSLSGVYRNTVRNMKILSQFTFPPSCYDSWFHTLVDRQLANHRPVRTCKSDENPHVLLP